MPILYEPALNLPGVAVEGLDGPTRQAVAELLHGRIKKHTFFASDSLATIPLAPAWDDEEAIPDWLMHDASWLDGQIERRPQIDVSYEGMEFHCTLDGFRRNCLRLGDGKRSLGEILASLEARHVDLSRGELLRRWHLLYQALAVFSLVGLFRRPFRDYREARAALLELDQERGFDGGYFDALTQFEVALEYASRAIKAAARLAQITPYEVGTTSEAIVKLRDSFSHLDRVVAGRSATLGGLADGQRTRIVWSFWRHSPPEVVHRAGQDARLSLSVIQPCPACALLVHQSGGRRRQRALARLASRKTALPPAVPSRIDAKENRCEIS